MPILVVFAVLAIAFGAIYWFSKPSASTPSAVDTSVEDPKQDAKTDVQNKL
ncbi:MAG: hypothetical protein KGL39_38440 [Patescibacteria group bacterium]|nr:hypothetical protein [Patescibacteria group bacterium]